MDEKEPLLKAESTLTDRYQTTIPEMVRKALKLGKGDKLEFLLDETGAVRVRKEEPQEPEEHLDESLVAFLALLEKDMAEHPERLVAVDQEWLDEIDKYTRDVEVDIDEALKDDED